MTLSRFAPVALSGLLLGSACVRAMAPPPEAITDPQVLLRNVQERAERIHSLRAAAHLKVSSPRGKATVKEYVAVERPASVRFETLGLFGPLGGAQSLVVCDGRTLSAYFPGEHKGFVGLPTAANFAYFVPLPLNPEEMIATLLGSSPTYPAGGAVTLRREKGLVVLAAGSVEQRWQVTLWIDPDRGGLLRHVEFSTDPQEVDLALDLSNYREVEGQPFPMTLNLQVPRELLEVRLTYSSVEINPTLPPDDFRFTFPKDTEIVRLD